MSESIVGKLFLIKKERQGKEGKPIERRLFTYEEVEEQRGVAIKYIQAGQSDSYLIAQIIEVVSEAGVEQTGEYASEVTKWITDVERMANAIRWYRKLHDKEYQPDTGWPDRVKTLAQAAYNDLIKALEMYESVS